MPESVVPSGGLAIGADDREGMCYLAFGSPSEIFFSKMFSIILIIECVVYVCTDKHVLWRVGGGVEDSMVELTRSKHLLWDLAVGLRLPGLPSKHFCISPTSGGLSPLA